MFDLDPVLLSRVQFAFTVSFHIIFPAFTIGLASWLAVLEGFYLKTKHPIYKDIYKFWVKIFAVTFGMGVVSGLVLSYQIGTNWSAFSDHAGSVIGPLLGYEVMTAFFLEASFLGIMLFGWERVSPKMHFVSTVIVAVGTLISAFWILSANSWMHTPTGYTIAENGLLYPKDWWQIVFNPSFPYRLVHMIFAAYLTTAFTVGGISAWYLWRGFKVQQARICFAMAMVIAVTIAPMQLLVGDFHGLNTLQHQPAKVAAMEGLWKTEKGAPLKLFGIPDEEKEQVNYAIEIPNLASWILTHDTQGEVRGLSSFDKDKRPPMTVIFYSFRLMVGIGLAMIFTGVVAAILYWRQQLFSRRWFQAWCMLMTPTGFLAVLSGWFVTEIGRQPYLVYGILHRDDMLSPVNGEQVALSLLVFVLVYAFVFGAGTYYILHLLAVGPDHADEEAAYGTHGLKHPANFGDIFPDKHHGDQHV